MSKILSIISIVLVALSAVVGYLNKTKFEGFNETLASTKADLSSTKNELATAAAKQKAAIEQLADATKDKETAESAAAALKSQATEATTALAEVKTVSSAKDTEIADLKTQLASTPKAPEGQQPVGEDPKVKELEMQIAATAEENKLLAGKIEAGQAEVAALRKVESDRKGALMAKGLSGTIQAYNPAWNFVVLNIGDRQKVVPGAEMVVTRDGRMMGKIKITSVEPSSSIGDVIVNTVPVGAQIAPGDTVIYPGS